jgi:hypothetical protein
MHFGSRLLAAFIIALGLGMVVVVTVHIGGVFALYVRQFSPLVGAFVGGGLTLWSASLPQPRVSTRAEEWEGYEQLSWVLIGCGIIMWGMSESFWRYATASGQSPFPSAADIGYASFPVLVFSGLLLQPSPARIGRRLLLVIDGLISTGSLLALAWYLLLGALIQTSSEANLATFLRLYYPTADVALLSCVVILLLRGQGSPSQLTLRHITLLIIALGLCCFVASDFAFHVLEHAGTYVAGTWIDLGWSLGLMILGLAAYLRRFPLLKSMALKEGMQQGAGRPPFSPVQLIPYFFLTCLFAATIANGVTTNQAEPSEYLVLLFATLAVVSLIVIRQLYTTRELVNLFQKQTSLLDEQLDEQRQVNKKMVEMGCEMESGVAHLQEVLARLANGDMQARATLPKGYLWPLAQNLNILAARLEQASSPPDSSTGSTAQRMGITGSYPAIRDKT